MMGAISSEVTAMFAVRLNAEKLPQTPGGPIAGPITYKVFEDVSAKGKQNPRIVSATLLPGWNFQVSETDLETIRKSEQGQKHLKRGIIEIRNPGADAKGEGFSPDFGEEDAIALIEEAEDLAWLHESKDAEERLVVKAAIKARISELEEELAILAGDASSRPSYG